ncbi:hypothetical protein JX265_011060 [Neoarthrinium moseri]|uniref:Calmodulin n=1 Tax=Neoarthrinium moseri TaxID=1658444 RepID=A0A9P9WCS4_9PEZI|nr:uncharacterized protein JN550_005042 [Neoarthrinium moseri]KAI1857645.1 hypothetical protein JX265_011060 [Neoarthrinium moseri]KAI1870499.1 hypothetical protein JN550_005042 [Neoarthrinium moseri]
MRADDSRHAASRRCESWPRWQRQLVAGSTDSVVQPIRSSTFDLLAHDRLRTSSVLATATHIIHRRTTPQAAPIFYSIVPLFRGDICNTPDLRLFAQQASAMAANYESQASTNYKEAFSLFDKRGNGRVALDSLGDLLRACGQNPTLSEIRDLEKNIGGDFDFETFSRVLNRPGGFRDPGEPDEYCRGFQVFDKDMTGFIGVGQLKYILTNLGEKMTDEEVDELLKSVDTSSGQVNYTDLVRTILAN